MNIKLRWIVKPIPDVTSTDVEHLFLSVIWWMSNDDMTCTQGFNTGKKKSHFIDNMNVRQW